MKKEEIAGELFSEGYNCAQSVVAAFSEEIGMEKEAAAKAVSGFGGGIGRLREVCGAVSGMVFVLSNIEGYSDPKDRTGKKELYIKVQELTGKFREEKGSIICRELLKGINADTSPVPSERTPEYYRTRGCRGCVECAAGILEKYLEEKKEKGK